jgi:hypothetical protein
MDPSRSIGGPAARRVSANVAPMNRALCSLLALGVAACGGSAPPAAAAPAPSPLLAPADVDLRDASALVAGNVVPLDGLDEGLAWPALRVAVARKPGDHAPLTIAVARAVPMRTVLRAVWTLRDADVHMETPDAAGVLRVIELRPKPDAPSTAGCHLAIFVGKSGTLRIAAPGGPTAIPGPDAPLALARALADERTRCTLRYVAFGAEDPDTSWGAVFDVAWAVDRDRSAGDARYVLGEPVHLDARAKRPPPS